MPSRKLQSYDLGLLTLLGPGSDDCHDRAAMIEQLSGMVKLHTYSIAMIEQISDTDRTVRPDHVTYVVPRYD